MKQTQVLAFCYQRYFTVSKFNHSFIKELLIKYSNILGSNYRHAEKRSYHIETILQI